MQHFSKSILIYLICCLWLQIEDQYWKGMVHRTCIYCFTMILLLFLLLFSRVVWKHSSMKLLTQVGVMCILIKTNNGLSYQCKRHWMLSTVFFFCFRALCQLMQLMSLSLLSSSAGSIPSTILIRLGIKWLLSVPKHAESTLLKSLFWQSRLYYWGDVVLGPDGGILQLGHEESVEEIVEEVLCLAVWLHANFHALTPSNWSAKFLTNPCIDQTLWHVYHIWPHSLVPQVASNIKYRYFSMPQYHAV